MVWNRIWNSNGIWICQRPKINMSLRCINEQMEHKVKLEGLVKRWIVCYSLHFICSYKKSTESFSIIVYYIVQRGLGSIKNVNKDFLHHILACEDEICTQVFLTLREITASTQLIIILFERKYSFRYFTQSAMFRGQGCLQCRVCDYSLVTTGFLINLQDQRRTSAVEHVLQGKFKWCNMYLK